MLFLNEYYFSSNYEGCDKIDKPRICKCIWYVDVNFYIVIQILENA